MTRRIKRMRDFEVTLQIKNDAFVAPPRELQRNWVINRALAEFADDLVHLDQLAARFVPGQPSRDALDRSQAELTDDEIMEDWQIPIMQSMAEVVTEGHGDVLEVGFGRGVASTMIQQQGVRSHTVIECNDTIVARFHRWKESYADRDVKVVHGMWQDVTDRLGPFDGVFFHTYPLNADEFYEQVAQSVTFAEHFFPTAARLLTAGGVFTYLTNEIDSLSRAHQRLLLRFFREFSVRIVQPLNLPGHVADAWWADSMAVVKAVR